MIIKTVIDMITVHICIAQIGTEGGVDTLLAEVHNKIIKFNEGSGLVYIIIIIDVVLMYWTHICRASCIIHICLNCFNGYIKRMFIID